MKAYGLTGKIGAGKSTVAKILALHNDIVILDTDSLAKQIIEDIVHRDSINRIFGTNVFDQNGKYDTKIAASLIFSKNIIKKNIEEFIHPLVINKVENTCIKNTTEKKIIVESALLFKDNMYKKFELGIIVVESSFKNRLSRLCKNRGLNKKDALMRIKHQEANFPKVYPIENIHILKNNKTYKQLETDTNILYKKF